MKTYKLTIEAKQGTYKVRVIESATLLIIFRLITTLGIFYPLTAGTIGITLGRWILINPNLMYEMANGNQVFSATARHEFIHVVQQRENGFFLFVVRYFYYFIKTRSYMKIPFEIEAYAHQDEQYYLKKRNRNDWRKYI
jgi:hypothetical protein